MTGFGRGEASDDNYKILIEIKSVNHRYCDVGIRVPRKLNGYEALLRSRIKSYASRGKIDIFMSFEDMTGKSTGIAYNRETAGAYLDGIRQLSRDFSLEYDVDAVRLSRFPDVFTMEEPDLDEEAITALLDSAMSAAGEAFVESRAKEGQQLREDLLKKLERLSSLTDEIERRSPEILNEYRAKLTAKVKELLGNTQVDDTVLATELVLYADKTCVDEEIVRLRTHILHMKETLEQGGGVGRKLDFLTQEMNREANTVLSKANDIIMADYGIEIKTEIEKIREQIQNIE